MKDPFQQVPTLAHHTAVSENRYAPPVPPPKRIFFGSFTELVELVEQTGIAGYWIDAAGGQKQFRTYTGGVLNWWASTRTLTFQGKLQPKADLEEAFDAMIAQAQWAHGVPQTTTINYATAEGCQR